MKRLFILFFCSVIFTGTTVGQGIEISDSQIAKTQETYVRKHEALNQKIAQGYKASLSELLEPEENTFGFHYAYSKYFPLGLSYNYTFDYFQLGVDVGLNFNKDKYDMNETIGYDPKGYVTLSPGFYTNYFSISCGVGLLESKKYITETEIEYTNNSYTSVTTTETKTAYHFMLRPNFKLFIPLNSNNDFFLSLNAGYDYAFKFKKTNGFHFGVGIQYAIEL